jgi:peptidoglycan/xylan/chitin deacetylase (PgdA/CDA1 family)
MDELEDKGIVGPSQGGGKDREVLVTSDDGPEDEPDPKE